MSRSPSTSEAGLDGWVGVCTGDLSTDRGLSQSATISTLSLFLFGYGRSSLLVSAKEVTEIRFGHMLPSNSVVSSPSLGPLKHLTTYVSGKDGK